jgi:hypothetical protein
MGVFLAFVVWCGADGGWSALQIGCLTEILLAGGAILVNNQRSDAFHFAATIPLLAGILALDWTMSNAHSLRGKIIFLLSAMFLTWIVIRPRFKRSPTRSDPDDPLRLHVNPEGNGNA